MSVDIKPFLQYLEKEKNIKKEEACALIVEAIKSSVEKSVMAGQNVEINADPKSGKLDAFVVLRVTDSVSDPLQEINPVAASLIEADVKVGQEVRKPINVADLGRIAAKTTQQLLNQRFRKIEKEQVFQEYKDKVGDIVTGTVRRTERGNVIIELGTAEAVLTHKERCHGDEFRTGDRIRCLLLEIREDPQRGREFVLSRANPAFVRRLLELEVAEIADKTVTIAAMARDPGYRTKIAVDSRDPKVDPVGACVGIRGSRVKNIVRELNNEKVDIIRWDADPVKFVTAALKPANIRAITADADKKRIRVLVHKDDLSLAIGRRGQNARLTSKMTGWDVDIEEDKRDAQVIQNRTAEAAHSMADILGVTEEVAQQLASGGMNSIEVILMCGADDIAEVLGADLETGQKILSAAQAAQKTPAA